MCSGFIVESFEASAEIEKKGLSHDKFGCHIKFSLQLELPPSPPVQNDDRCSCPHIVGLANWQPSDPKIPSLSMLVKIPQYFCDSKPRNHILDVFLAWRVPLQHTCAPPDASLAYPSPTDVTRVSYVPPLLP
jgi:hypothetical protein